MTRKLFKILVLVFFFSLALLQTPDRVSATTEATLQNPSPPVYVYRVSPTGWVCGTIGSSPNIIADRGVPVDSNHEIKLQGRKCNTEPFSLPGSYEFRLDANRDGVFDSDDALIASGTYNAGDSTFTKYVDPVADYDAYGPGHYVVMVYSQGSTIPKHGGILKIWEEYQVPNPPPHDNIYKVNPTGPTCGNLISGILVPNDANHDLEVFIQKCNGGPFVEDGQAYVYVDGVPRWGPFSYQAGTIQAFLGRIDPLDLGFTGTHSYQIVAYSSSQPTDPNKYSGIINAWNTVPGTEPLAGKNIALNPGHGFYDKRSGQWVFQRGLWWGIREDLVNVEIQMYVANYLEDLGATVIYLRESDKNAGPCESILPCWQEAARHFLKYQGAPASVYNPSGYSNNLSKDIASRPLAANYYGADLLISVHNNGGGGTGTETWYDTTGQYHDPAQALDLANHVHPRLVNMIRSEYNASWTDRGIKPSNGAYNENRLAEMPAILIEVAFMDKQSPDNNALHDEGFKDLVAQAIVLGICDYYSVSCTLAPSLPNSPQNLYQQVPAFLAPSIEPELNRR
jgi:N-acetylmuramoyl-L-alanine amidase